MNIRMLLMTLSLSSVSFIQCLSQPTDFIQYLPNFIQNLIKPTEKTEQQKKDEETFKGFMEANKLLDQYKSPKENPQFIKAQQDANFARKNYEINCVNQGITEQNCSQFPQCINAIRELEQALINLYKEDEKDSLKTKPFIDALIRNQQK